jgi:hypothetical protein
MHERRAAIVRLAAALPLMDHFAVLSVDVTATFDDVHAQFYKLSRSYHPDRLPAALKDLEGATTAIMSRLLQAHSVLSDPMRRAAYAAELRGRGSLPPPASQTTESGKSMVRRALRIMANNHLEALALTTTALATPDGESAEVQTAHIWIVFKTPKRTQEREARESLKAFDALLKVHSTHADGYYYRAQVHKQLQQANAALKDLKATVLWEVGHVNALRELRLYNMRKLAGMTVSQALGLDR